MLIKVKVFTGSKKQEVVQKNEDSFEVRIKSKPEKGLANKEVVEVLASYFNISTSDLKLIKGHKQRSKIFKLINSCQISQI